MPSSVMLLRITALFVSQMSSYAAYGSTAIYQNKGLTESDITNLVFAKDRSRGDTFWQETSESDSYAVISTSHDFDSLCATSQTHHRCVSSCSKTVAPNAGPGALGTSRRREPEGVSPSVIPHDFQLNVMTGLLHNSVSNGRKSVNE